MGLSEKSKTTGTERKASSKSVGPTRLTGCVRVLTFTLDCGKNAGQCECQRAKSRWTGLGFVFFKRRVFKKKKKKSLELMEEGYPQPLTTLSSPEVKNLSQIWLS